MALNLNTIVDVVVEVSPLAQPRPTFNQALVIGSSGLTIGVPITTTERLRLYTSTTDMLTDRFVVGDPEYDAALLYFAQSPAPDKFWVGVKGTSPAESWLQAVTACRVADQDWYICICPGAAKSDHEAIAAYIETATPVSLYAFTTADAGVLAGTTSPPNVLSYLKGLDYSRTMGQYSTAHAGAVAAIVGYAMGQNSGLANSMFTLKFKSEVGVTAEAVTANQVNLIEGQNGNLYLNYANTYTFFEQGKMVNGRFFDELLGIDMLVADIQLSVMDLLVSNPKIPQTDDGVTQIVQSINDACENAAVRGFVGGGIWTGSQILNLNNGDMLPKGYMVQAASLSAQSVADRAARKCPPIYVAIKESGAIHSVLCACYVTQ